MALNDGKELIIPVNAYRQLEYINFSGTEYVLTNDKPTNNRYYYLNYSLGSIVNDRFIFAANGDANSSGGFRVTVRTSTTTAQGRYGRNSSGNTNIGTVSTNVIYQNRLRIFSGFNAYFATYNTATSSVIGSANMSTASFTPSNMYPFAIMGYNNGGTVGNMTVGKVYRYFYRIGDASGELGANCYPCQRKSDDVCGLYDIINNVFLPMVGTNITTAAAGPIVNENPDWKSNVKAITIPEGYVKKIEDSNGNILWKRKVKVTFNCGNMNTTLVNGLQRGLRRNKKADGTKFVAAAIDETLGANGSTITTFSDDITQMCSFLTEAEMNTLYSLINDTYSGSNTEITLGTAPYALSNGKYGYIIFPGLISTGKFVVQWRSVTVQGTTQAGALVETWNPNATGGQWIYKNSNTKWIIRSTSNVDTYLQTYQNTSTTNFNYIYTSTTHPSTGNYANIASNINLQGTYQLTFEA